MVEEVFDSKDVVNSSVSVGNSSTEVLEANPARGYALFSNDSDTVIYLALGADAVLNKGIRLNANGGSYEINKTNMFKGAVNAICNGSAKNLCFVEGE